MNVTARVSVRMWFAIATVAIVSCSVCGAAIDNGGLTVRDGKLYRDGQVYRGIGVNYCDLFQELIKNPDSKRTLNGLKFLAEKDIPFVRAWFCGFWPSDWDLYFEDKQEWFRRMDLVVETAEECGIGIVADFFWRTATYPDMLDEYQDQWGNPDSETHAFMRQYVREVVTRYNSSPAIWGWEFANEMNLSCDLPNGMNFLGREIPHLNVSLEKHERNLMTYEIAETAYRAFAREVRKYDERRFITTGNSRPRKCSYHNATDGSWDADRPAEAFEAFKWMHPDAVDVVSVHFYGNTGDKPRYAGASGIRGVLGKYKEFARRLDRPLFVGEFAAAAHDKKQGISIEEFRAVQEKILDAIVLHKIDLAAYWVFDYTADRSGPGPVRKDNKWSWVIDQIAGYNAMVKQVDAAE